MGIVSYSYMHRSAISHNRKANLRPPMLPSHLVNMARTTAISAVHAASAGSLKSRLARQASPQLHKRTRNLVAHGSMALVVVHRRSSSMAVVRASSPHSLGRCGSGGCRSGSPARSGGVGALGAEQTGLEARTGSGARGARGAGSDGALVAGHEWHDCGSVGWMVVRLKCCGVIL
jgi:hypothetical protein